MSWLHWSSPNFRATTPAKLLLSSSVAALLFAFPFDVSWSLSLQDIPKDQRSKPHSRPTFRSPLVRLVWSLFLTLRGSRSPSILSMRSTSFVNRSPPSCALASCPWNSIDLWSLSSSTLPGSPTRISPSITHALRIVYHGFGISHSVMKHTLDKGMNCQLSLCTENKHNKGHYPTKSRLFLTRMGGQLWEE